MNERHDFLIDQADKKLSFRFTCRKDMSVIALSAHCGRAQDPPAFRASLQEDLKGFPSGTLLGSTQIIPKADRWITFPLDPVQLTEGRIYHLVLDVDLDRGGHHPVGVIGPAHSASFSFTDVLNGFRPNDEDPDPKENVLTFDGKEWKVMGQQPLYALHGTGGALLGDPYDQTGVRPVHGNGTPKDPSDDLLQGASLHPHVGMDPKGFCLRVRKQGSPKSPLNFRVYVIDYLHHRTTLGYSGKALEPSQVPTSFKWVTFGIPKELSNTSVSFPPECRYVTFQTDSGRAAPGAAGCEDCYLISDIGNSGGLAGAAEMSFDGGPHLSRAARSSDGGAHWIDEFERDANIVIQAPPSIPPSPPVIQPLPTPGSLMGSFGP